MRCQHRRSGGYTLTRRRPVVSVSRSLTKSERNYVDLELECLVVVFACQKFDQYIYGKRVTVETGVIRSDAGLLQPETPYQTFLWCKSIWSWCSTLPCSGRWPGTTSGFCITFTIQGWRKLLANRQGGFSTGLGYKTLPPVPVGSKVHTRNRPQTPCVHFQSQ